MLLLPTEVAIEEKTNTWSDWCHPMYHWRPQIIIQGNWTHAWRHTTVNTDNKEKDTESWKLLWAIVQELCESRGGRPGLSVLTSLLVSVDVKIYWTCFGIDHNLSLICQLTSEDIKQHFIIIIIIFCGRKAIWSRSRSRSRSMGHSRLQSKRTLTLSTWHLCCRAVSSRFQVFHVTCVALLVRQRNFPM